jgi:hypothetical protein
VPGLFGTPTFELSADGSWSFSTWSCGLFFLGDVSSLCDAAPSPVSSGVLQRCAPFPASDIDVLRSSFLAAVVSASSLNARASSDLAVDAGLDAGGSEAMATESMVR